jgi:hypothetical protein
LCIISTLSFTAIATILVPTIHTQVAWAWLTHTQRWCMQSSFSSLSLSHYWWKVLGSLPNQRGLHNKFEAVTLNCSILCILVELRSGTPSCVRRWGD